MPTVQASFPRARPNHLKQLRRNGGSPRSTKLRSAELFLFNSSEFRSGRAAHRFFNRLAVPNDAVTPRPRSRQQLRRPDEAGPARFVIRMVEALLCRKPSLRLAGAQQLNHV